jgi:hypothetical protein
MTNLDDIFGSESAAPVAKPVECPAPGIYHNIPAPLYHSWPCVSSTFVKGFAVNPYAAKFKPFRGSPAADLGSACHSWTLEGPDAFDKEFYVPADIPCPPGRNPKGWKSTNEYKELAAYHDAEANGRTILTPEQWEAVQEVDKSLRDHPTTSQILNRGFNELSLVFRHEETGLMIKARLDDYYEGIPSDLKTAADITWFHRDIYKRKYELQAALYSMGAEANGLPVNYFCFLAAQTTETYPVRAGYIQPDKLIAAQSEVNRLLGLIKECRDRDTWPNFTIPLECHTLDQVVAASLLEEW